MDLGAWNGGVSRSACDQACTYTSKGGIPSLNYTLSTLYKGCYDTGTLSNSISCGESWACQDLLQVSHPTHLQVLYSSASFLHVTEHVTYVFLSNHVHLCLADR